jgi:hypothetical protein
MLAPPRHSVRRDRLVRQHGALQRSLSGAINALAKRRIPGVALAQRVAYRLFNRIQAGRLPSLPAAESLPRTARGHACVIEATGIQSFVQRINQLVHGQEAHCERLFCPARLPEPCCMTSPLRLENLRLRNTSIKVRNMALPEILKKNLRIPVVGSPLFIISHPPLVLAQCKAGIVGSFPALNARPEAQLDEWLAEITEDLAAYDAKNPEPPVRAVRRQPDRAQVEQPPAARP